MAQSGGVRGAGGTRPRPGGPGGASVVSVSPASLLCPYGLEHGDEALPAEGDGFLEELQRQEPFTLFAFPHRTACVSALTPDQRSLGPIFTLTPPLPHPVCICSLLLLGPGSRPPSDP